jgi:hypothetical protein
MADEKKTPSGRTHSEEKPSEPEREPVLLAPTAEPAETVERIVSRRNLIIEDGDVMIIREAASLSRDGGMSPLATTSNSQYRMSIRGNPNDHSRVFSTYEGAVADGEAIAAQRGVRVFYTEDAAMTLLNDYRPTSGG